jgi:hypothetical protein
MFALELIYAGLEALQDYIALHVLTCLIPAFFTPKKLFIIAAYYLAGQ